MIIYFAGLSGAPEQTEYKMDKKNRLLSYFEIELFPGGGRFHHLWDLKIKRLQKIKNDK